MAYFVYFVNDRDARQLQQGATVTREQGFLLIGCLPWYNSPIVRGYDIAREELEAMEEEKMRLRES